MPRNPDHHPWLLSRREFLKGAVGLGGLLLTGEAFGRPAWSWLVPKKAEADETCLVDWRELASEGYYSSPLRPILLPSKDWHGDQLYFTVYHQGDVPDEQLLGITFSPNATHQYGALPTSAEGLGFYSGVAAGLTSDWLRVAYSEAVSLSSTVGAKERYTNIISLAGADIFGIQWYPPIEIGDFNTREKVTRIRPRILTQEDNLSVYYRELYYVNNEPVVEPFQLRNLDEIEPLGRLSPFLQHRETIRETMVDARGQQGKQITIFETDGELIVDYNVYTDGKTKCLFALTFPWEDFLKGNYFPEGNLHVRISDEPGYWKDIELSLTETAGRRVKVGPGGILGVGDSKGVDVFELGEGSLAPLGNIATAGSLDSFDLARIGPEVVVVTSELGGWSGGLTNLNRLNREQGHWERVSVGSRARGLGVTVDTNNMLMLVTADEEWRAMMANFSPFGLCETN